MIAKATPQAETIQLDTLTLDPSNVRAHPTRNLEAIKGSLKRFGQVKPIVVDAASVVVAGNGLVEAARALGWSEVTAIRTKLKGSDRTAYSIADNRTAELAEWTPELAEALASLADEAALETWATGFDQDELDALIADVTEPGEVVEDEVPAVPETPITRPGDLWTLGPLGHRVLCGDSTKAEDVARVMDGESAGLCFTSPPYAQQRDYGKKIDDWDGLMQGVFANLPMADDGQVLVNLGLIHRDGEWWPYWEGWIEWMRAQGWRRFGWYVWDQGSGLPGAWNGRLGPCFEFVFHFNRKGTEARKWVDKKPESIKHHHHNKSTMRKADGTTTAFMNPSASGQPRKVPDSVIRVSRQVGSDGHPAQFPVGLPSFVAKSWPGLIFDPYLGSGSTLIAAEQLGRKAVGIEIEPKYCDVVCRRWMNATARVPVRQDGKEFDK